MNPLPVNFETKLKDAKSSKSGYPYSIKAEDLMKDFVYAKLEVDPTVHVSGLYLSEGTVWGDNGHQGRSVKIAGIPTGIHPFRVLFTEKNEIADREKLNPDEIEITISGGNVYHEKDIIEIEPLTIKAGEKILIKITRNASSRLVTKAEIIVEGSDFDSKSTVEFQYIHIAQIKDGVLTQLFFQNIHVFEDLAIINGEFKLVSLAMLGENYYDAPAP